jgi:hypothetical protein
MLTSPPRPASPTSEPRCSRGRRRHTSQNAEPARPYARRSHVGEEVQRGLGALTPRSRQAGRRRRRDARAVPCHSDVRC